MGRKLLTTGMNDSDIAGGSQRAVEFALTSEEAGDRGQDQDPQAAHGRGVRAGHGSVEGHAQQSPRSAAIVPDRGGKRVSRPAKSLSSS
jgi:hypothetical protein